MMIACDQVGAYVVDALTDEERAQFAAHLESCDSCQREVREFSETTAALAALVATAPPPGLRAQVLAQAARVRPLPPLEASVTTIHRSETVPSSTVGTSVGSPVGARRADATVVSLDERRTGRRGFLRWGVAAAAVGVVSLGAAGTVSGWRTARTRGEAMAAQKELMAAPDAELVAFAPATGNDVKGSYLVSRQQNRAMFVAERMPRLPEGKVFQQWTIAGGDGATPEANVTFDSITDAIWLTGDVARAAFLAISIENAGGATTVNKNTILGQAAL